MSFENQASAAIYGGAVQFCIASHAKQTRKGSESPYFAHPLAVSALVIEHGGTPDQAVAALLHDVVEDCDVSLASIRGMYGEAVAFIVEDCTDGVPGPDGKKSPWQERKAAYLADLFHKPTRSLLVILADKVHNAESIVHDFDQHGSAIFSRFTGGPDGTAWYYGKLADMFGHMSADGKLPLALIRRLTLAAEKIEAKAKVRPMDRRAAGYAPFR